VPKEVTQPFLDLGLVTGLAVPDGLQQERTASTSQATTRSSESQNPV